MEKRTFAIVGAGLAGAKAAETLRSEGFDGRVVLIGDEDERPYERPPLSKERLRGEAERESVFVHEPGFYAEHDVELRTGARVESLDVGAAQLVLDGGERIGYDALLLATGAEPRRLPIPGADLDGVHYLRTLADSEALHERLRPGARVVIVGAGWIGCEVAASARQLGADVTLVEMAELPLERVLGPELGRFYRNVHEAHGVQYAGGARIERIEGGGRVERAVLAGGGTVEADAIVIGVGVAPRVALAEAAGLDVRDGVRVDAQLRASVPGVYAAGDVASAWHPLLGRHLRVEHWANALNQGPAAARSMMGAGADYDRVPYFFSDQYEVGMEYSGHADASDEVVIRGDLEAGEFIAFWLHDGRVRAGMNVNVWGVTDPIQALVRAGAPVDPRRLAATDEPLEQLATEAHAQA